MALGRKLFEHDSMLIQSEGLLVELTVSWESIMISTALAFKNLLTNQRLTFGRKSQKHDAVLMNSDDLG